MFDIGFSEILLVFVIGLIVLGPERLPVAVRTVMGWIRALRSLASNVQQELAQELKLQEFQDSLKKVEEVSKGVMPAELKESMEELRKSADSMHQTYRDALHPTHDATLVNEPVPRDEHNSEKSAVEVSNEVVSGRTPAQAHSVTTGPTSVEKLQNQHEQTASVVSKRPNNLEESD